MYFQNQFQGKKVVVIGHTGFKGSWLTLWLEQLGATVYGFSKDIPTTPSHFELAGLAQSSKDFRGNIVDSKQLTAFLREVQPDVLFHMGAAAIVSECIENPQEAFLTNTMGTVNVLEAIRHLPSLKAAVIITSDKCYENVEWIYGYRENDRLGGKDPYSASKAAAELVFSSYFRTYLLPQNRVKVATARAGNVIGGGDWAINRIVPDCVRAWTENRSVRIRNPHSTRPWQHVLEPLSGYLALAADLLQQNTTNNGESFNFGPKAEVNKAVGELIDEMKGYWKSAQVEYDQNHNLKEKEAGLLKLCCDKALSRLSWSPTLNFDETVEMTTSWYQNWQKSSSNVREFTQSQISKYCRLAEDRQLAWAKK
jgi:CDP-glucose 4,6-dehydratase